MRRLRLLRRWFRLFPQSRKSSDDIDGYERLHAVSVGSRVDEFKLGNDATGQGGLGCGQFGEGLHALTHDCGFRVVKAAGHTTEYRFDAIIGIVSCACHEQQETAAAGVRTLSAEHVCELVVMNDDLREPLINSACVDLIARAIGFLP